MCMHMHWYIYIFISCVASDDVRRDCQSKQTDKQTEHENYYPRMYVCIMYYLFVCGLQQCTASARLRTSQPKYLHISVIPV